MLNSSFSATMFVAMVSWFQLHVTTTLVKKGVTHQALMAKTFGL
jgi:hypothetical protein